jgi:hypothetical protein
MASTFENIIRKTGRKPVSCKCNVCKSQCSKAPCLGTQTYPKGKNPNEVGVGWYTIKCIESSNLKLESYQYLISKGYDMPQYLLGGKTLQEAGLAEYYE